MPIYGLWNGGYANYAPADIESDVERFETMQDVHDALATRHGSGHYAHTFNFVNRPAENVATPCVGDDCYIDVYLNLDIDPDTGNVLVHDNGPDYRIAIDKRGRTYAERN